MRVKTILKATSVLLSAVMLVSSAQVGLTAFAAETEETVAVQETAQTTVSPSVQLAAETQEATDEVIQEETTQPETEVQTEAQAQTEAEPEAEPQDDKDEAAVGAEAEDAVGVTSTFNEGNGTLYITGSGDMPNYSYVSDVPWYSKRGLITSVVIEEGVTSIGRYAFYDCERVTSVLIADTVTKIESEAIEKCKALESIYIPDSVTSIGSYAFQGCSSLKNVRMSNSVKSLSYQLFYGCSSLESFEIPDSVTDIGSSVFAGTAITTLTIPNSVTSIGGDKLSGLTNVTVRATIGSYAKLYCDRNGIDFVSTGVWNHEGKCGENVSYFLDSASGVMTISGSGDMMYISQTYYTPWYLYNDYIKSVVFEEGVTSITNYTLNRCKNLESVTIPDTVTSIGYSAFEYSSLESIYIPDSVTSIGSYTFYGCSSLKNARMSNSVKSLSYQLFYGCSSLESFEIPDSVTDIGSSVFQGCKSLESVEIPDSVTSISNQVFQGCESLKTVEIPANIKQYSSNLFNGCKALTSFNIADGVTSIGDGVFTGTGLKAITIPSSVTYIGSYAFANCASLKKVKMSDSVTTYNTGLFSGCTSLESFEIPSTVTAIGHNVFYNTALKKIEIPDSVTYIGNAAFRYCSNLTDVVIPESVTSTGSDAFRNCEKLQYILVPETVTSVGTRLVADNEKVIVVGLMGSAAYDYTVRENVRFSPVTGAGDGYAICETGEQYKNMTLRFTSQDGEKVYTKILTADDNNVIFGIDREKTYTAEVCSRNGNVFCSKDDISFGESKSVSVAFENAKTPLDVKVKVLDEYGDETGGFTASWTDGSGKYIAEGKDLTERIDDEELSCEIKLSKALSQLYKAPGKANITVSEDSENIVTVELEKYATYTISGTVTDVDDALANVKVTASQDIGDKTSVYNAVTDDDGNYSLTLTEGEYQLTFSKKGYYDKSVSGALTEDKEENISLEKLAGSKLGCTVRFNKLSASTQKNLSLDELSVSVFNQTQDKAVTDYTLQNNFFYFQNEDVSQGDTLKFTFADASGVYDEAQQTLTFNEGTFYFAVTMTEKGKLSCKIKTTPNSGNVMLLFDENGKFVDTYRFRNLTLETDHLNAGSYSAVVMGESEPAVTADSLEAFGEYGFTENEDYRVYSAEVSSGELTEIDEIEIPEYSSDKLIYLDPDKTRLTANNTTVAMGQYTVLKAEYSVKEEYALDAENISLSFAIPENLFMPTNGVTLDGVLISDYTYENGVLTVNTNKTSGIVRACLYNVLPAEKVTASAKLYFTLNGKDRVQSVGSLDLKLSELDFSVPRETSQTNITATGTTFANAEIELYDNGTVVASSKSNASGDFIIPFELYKPFSKSTHKIWVEVKAPGGVTIRSQQQTVEYDGNMPVLSKVYMCGSFGEIPVDFINPTSVSINYSYAPSKPMFTFKAEFSGDASLIKNVVIITTDSKGRVTEIPTVYDEETGMFVGSHKFASDEIPADLNVSFDSEYDESGIDLVGTIDEVLSENRLGKEVLLFDSLLRDNPGTLRQDSAGILVFSLSCGNRRMEATMPPDKSSIKIEYYCNDEHISTEEASVKQIDSPNDVIQELKNKGFEEVKSSGDSSEQTGVTPLINTDPKKGEQDEKTVSQDGFMTENKKTLDPDFVTRLRNNYETIKLLSGLAWDKFVSEYMSSDTRTLWEDVTGDNSLKQWADIKGLLDSLEDCYKRRGIDTDVNRGDYYILAALSSMSSIGTFGINATSVAGYLIFATSNIIGNHYSDDGSGGLVSGMVMSGVNDQVGLIKNLNKYVNQNRIKRMPRKEFRKMIDNHAAFGVGIISSVATFAKDKKMKEEIEKLKKTRDACIEEEQAEKISGKKKLKGHIDPSGYICEAVDSNRVEGVTCTVFYSPNPDGSNAVVWNSEEAGQQNPQLSDSMGHYEWFVPVGYWQVKYEKDGYATTYSDWLPVPPPQTEVNIAMTSLKAPEIKSVYAYQNEIDIEFSQYMNTYTVADGTVTITLNGEKVSGRIVPVNAENGFDNPVINYATKFRFIPDENFSKDDVVTVSVKNAANYADNTINDFEGEYTVILKPEAILADETVTLTMKDTVEIDIEVDPGEAGANQNVSVTSGSSLIEILTPSVTTDENGKAKVKVRGILPGEAEITYQLENSDCTGATTLDIQMPIQKVEPVTASVKSGTTLNNGDKIYLSCATKGAEIYYTTDLSCPCNLTGNSRIKYTGPIEITEYTTIIAYAVKDGMEDSRTTLFIYDVAPKPEKLPQVTASVESGSTVDRGTKISLSCEIDGAEIYYTTDMSCPCKTENPARTKYTQPIEINGYTTIAAYAVKDGMEDSQPRLFIFNVNEVMGDADGDGAFTISDVTYIQKYLAELIEVDDATVAKWDYDKDGVVTISDATFLQLVLADLASF